MAVSLTQASKRQSLRQSMAYPATATYMPMPEDFHQSYPQPFPQHSYIPPPVQPQWDAPPQQYDHPGHYYNQHAYRQRSSFGDEQPPPPPPRPPKTPIEPAVEEIPTLPPRNRASTIEPDPLPPHSNPQTLTHTQSAAFSASSPIPPVRIGQDEVWNPNTGFALYVITREAAHMPNFMSSKPLLTVRSINGVQIGNVRFHTITTNNIDLTVNGRFTSISHSLIHNRWGFQSTTRPNMDEKWYWKKDKSTGGAKLEGSKKNGHTLARMKGDLLTFENRLSDASYDEVLLSAIAMAEAARRAKRKGDISDLASAIGDFAHSGGGDGGGGDGGGGGGH